MKARLSKFIMLPLVRVSVTIFLNLLIVVAVIAWLFSQQQCVDGEWQWRRCMACLFIDQNGYYISALPSHGATSWNFRQKVWVESKKDSEETAIESNLALEHRSLILPGLAFWWSTRPTDPFDRIVVRVRHGLWFGIAVAMRFLLHRFIRNRSGKRDESKGSIATA